MDIVGEDRPIVAIQFVFTYQGLGIANLAQAGVESLARIDQALTGHKAKGYCQVPEVHTVSAYLIPVRSQGPRTSLSLARNEHEGVQVIIAPLTDAAFSLKLSTSALRERATGTELAGASVTVRPVGYIGYEASGKLVSEAWPDPLLEEATVFVEPGKLQPLWVDVFVPEQAAAGSYETAVTLHREQTVPLTVPIDVTVYDFTLPQRPALPTAFGTCYAPSHRQLLEHRLGLTHMMLFRPGFTSHGGYPLGEREFAEVRPMIEEALAELAAFGGRHFDIEIPRIPGCFAGGADSIGAHGDWRPSYSEAQRQYIIRYYRDYAQFLRERGLMDSVSVYLWDEPAESAYPLIRDLRELIRAAAPELKCIIPGSLRSELIGVIDQWCPLTNVYDKKQSFARERQAAGDEVWWYITGAPEAPYAIFSSVQPERDLLSARLLFWMTWKYDIDGFLYWSVNAGWSHGFPFIRLGDSTNCYWQKGKGPYDFGNGRLVYPIPVSPAEADSATLPGIGQGERAVSSIRLEAIRDGLEDYDYLALLHGLVRKASATASATDLEEARALLAVPDDLVASLTSYTDQPAKLYRTREQVARLIERLSAED